MSSTDIISVEGSGHECDAKLDTWLRDLLAITPGCLPQIRKRQLILACRELFEQSCVWRTTIGPKRLTANKKRYYLSPFDAYSDVTRVFSVDFNGAPLRLLQRRPTGNEPDASSPLAFFMEGPDQVRLWPQSRSTVENALTFYVALAPKQTVKHLPRMAMTHLYDAIFDGAAGRLLSQPAKPYSDPVRAQYHLNRFRAAIGKYGAQGKQNFSGAPSWSYPRFGK